MTQISIIIQEIATLRKEIESKDSIIAKCEANIQNWKTKIEKLSNENAKALSGTPLSTKR